MKTIKKLVKIAGWTLFGVLFILGGIVFALRYPSAQTYFAKQAAAYLSRELQTTVSVERLYFKPFSAIVLNGLYVEDLQGDTLLHAANVAASVDLWRLRDGHITLKELIFSNSQFMLKQSANGTNLAFLIDYFSPTPGGERKPSRKRVQLAIETVVLSDASFRYQRSDIDSERTTEGIDFNDIQLTAINGDFSTIDLTDHLFKSTINNLTFREKSGFTLRSMDALATIDTNRITLADLYLETNRSQLRDYLQLDFEHFSAFGDFIDAVDIELNLNRAQIHAGDIAYFAPEVASIHFDVGLSGVFTGRVSAITARQVSLQAADSTRLLGDFTIVGLPDIDKTVFDIQLHHLETNPAEIESLVSELSSSSTLVLPEIFHSAGPLRYEGLLKGYYHDFSAEGILHTALGEVETAINLMVLDGGQYAGNLSSLDFDVGTLLSHNTLGHAGFELTVDGRGFTAEAIDGMVKGHLSYLDFNGYRYDHIDLQGTVTDQQVTGHIFIDDAHLQLDVNGNIDLNPSMPKYAVDAVLGYAHLRELKLYKKAPLIIQDTEISTELWGNTVNNITGNFATHHLQFQIDSSAYTIDSLLIVATGEDSDRLLQLYSDVADVTIDGQVEWGSLTHYFRSLAMRYIPSLGFTRADFEDQAFTINATLKNTEPLTALIIPQLSLPEGATMQARFSSADRLANMNILIPQISYGNIHAARLIMDETAFGDTLRLAITSDRISIDDSLYIDNVNLSNTLSYDSLYFNLKLADLTSANQLDLNGIAHFRSNSPVEIGLLPSIVTLNEEPWQLNEDALFYLEKGKLRVHGFELFKDQQAVLLAGVLSDAADDNATLTFRDFDLKTLNPITQASGIELSGVLDGRMDVSSVFKTPYALANMTANNVHVNQTEIGAIRLQADFDQTSELINVQLDIVKGGVQTLAATGTYNAAAETDKLNVHSRLTNTELIVFQPFIGRLVSDVSGNVSADFQVTGSVTAPLINGVCQLHDAAFTVNYLNTPYRINDEIPVVNSTLVLHDLMIADAKNNQAIANGKVDMRNPLIPDIAVTVDAKQFLILNTTLRHNPLYYGTAYGTGTFSFQGPTNAMHIRIQARTDENTRFHIPLNAAGTVTDNDFIRFVSPDTTDAPQSRARLFEGLTLDMDLQITPEVDASLYTDLGELSGRGEGLISLRISNLGDFEMFGDYTINSGKFTFTAQDFINKIFDINQGGTIRWTGQPSDATINLTAVYGQRTSLGPLYNAAGRETVEQRVLAQAEMNLNGSLMRPDITFALNFPNDPYVKDELQSYLSDVNNVNQQALSLIVRRSFAPGSATDFSRELNNTLLSAGTELAFNQLNNLITQSFNLNFVDLNIRSLNDASASLRFFNDRLIFTGGVTDRRNLNDLNLFSDRVVTDAELLYLIRKDGRLVLRGSNRLNSRNFLPLTINENYVSALGLVYRQEFDTFEEFLKRLTTIRNKKEEEEETEPAVEPGGD